MKKEEVHNRYREEESEDTQETLNTEGTQEVELETNPDVDVEAIDPNEEIKKLQEEIKALQDKYLRTFAEHENFKKRINEERVRDRTYANQGLLEQIINVTDIFDKAVNVKTDDPKLENFLIGFKMINENIKQVLENEGVKKINAVGEVFDAKYHMAVETDFDKDKDENIILEEIQTGYIFKDRILRPSRVKVNKKQGGMNNE